MQKSVGPVRPGGKSKDIATTSAGVSESESFISGHPVIVPRLIPRFSAVLGRSPDYGVTMDDLDQLQLDLEKMVSASAVRNRALRAEIEALDRVEERKKGKSFDKGSLKRKRPEERSKYKDLKNGSRPPKKQYSVHITNLVTKLPARPEAPRVNVPKNDTSEKFWASVEPYCAAITQSHSVFLEQLIEECGQEIDVKVPPLGDYYANEWNDSATNAEQDLGLGTKSGDSKKNGLSSVIDTFANLKTQRLLAALIEEKVMTSFPTVTGKLKQSDLNIIKPSANPRPAICMDSRLKKNLVEQGILSLEDLKSMEEDEILQEIKKCQQELATVNEYNVEELNRLKDIVGKELKRQEIKATLEKVDSQILELYSKVMNTKREQITQVKDEDLDEAAFTKAAFTKALKEFEGQTDVLLKQQCKLQKDLAELND